MSVRVIRNITQQGVYMSQLEVGQFFVCKDGDVEDHLLFIRTKEGAIAMGEAHERGDVGWGLVYPVDVEIVVKE